LYSDAQFFLFTSVGNCKRACDLPHMQTNFRSSKRLVLSAVTDALNFPQFTVCVCVFSLKTPTVNVTIPEHLRNESSIDAWPIRKNVAPNPIIDPKFDRRMTKLAHTVYEKCGRCKDEEVGNVNWRPFCRWARTRMSRQSILGCLPLPPPQKANYMPQFANTWDFPQFENTWDFPQF
jgi:hypothetical protein